MVDAPRQQHGPEVVVSDRVAEVFCDGIASISVLSGVARINLSRADYRDTTNKRKMIVANIAIPEAFLWQMVDTLVAFRAQATAARTLHQTPTPSGAAN